ncbi:MAG: PAS domain S-box protein, partial [Thermodesulfobacteriota bacterium]
MRALFPHDGHDQALRMQRFFMAAASYAVCIGLLYYFLFQGQFGLSLRMSVILTVVCAVYNIGVFALLRTGINKRLSDPSLTLLQIIVALGFLLCVTFYIDAHRTVLLPFYLVIFVFGVFQLKVRDFLLMTLLTLAGYGFVIFMLYYHRPERMTLSLEITNWIILATVLPWFSIVGGYISNLRTTIHSVNDELRDSMLRYKSLFENMLDIVLVVDAQHRVLIANPLFYATTGISPENATVYCKAFIHPEDLPRVEKGLLARLPEQELITDFQFRIKDLADNALYVECNARCIKNEGQIMGMQLMLRDITQRKRLEDELRNSYDHLSNTREVTIMGLAKLAEYRDKATGGHLERLREYCRILTQEVAKHPAYSDYITEKYIDALYLSCILHDIGKVAIPDAIL